MMDRGGLEVLSLDTCRRLLSETTIGRIAFIAAGQPVIFPVNFRFHRNRVVFRTTTGEKLDAAALGAAVAFEVDGWDEEARKGWSVLVRGTATEVMDPDELQELRSLGLSVWADSVARDRWVSIVPDEITGRRII